MANKENTRNFKIFNFNESYVAPVYKNDKKNNFITWGAKNDYPSYLLNLYNNYGSSLHKAIINKKTKLISGLGFNDVVNVELAEFLKVNKMNHEVRKAALDYEIFNSFAFEIIYTNGGELSSVKHIPVHKLRVGIETDELNFPYFLYSNDWANYRKEGNELQAVREYNPYIKQGKQIYLYTEYNPDSESYSVPYYSTSLNYIELGYEISKFHLNQAKQGYAPSFLLNFRNSSIPTEDEMEEFAKAFENEYSSTSNAGKVIITYSENEGGVELNAIQLNDSDERFIALHEQLQENIVMASEIPPQLVILTAGKLGSTDERKELMAEFQQSYITPRQEVMEEVINEIFSVQFDEEVTLKEFTQIDTKPVDNTNNNTKI